MESREPRKYKQSRTASRKRSGRRRTKGNFLKPLVQEIKNKSEMKQRGIFRQGRISGLLKREVTLKGECKARAEGNLTKILGLVSEPTPNVHPKQQWKTIEVERNFADISNQKGNSLDDTDKVLHDLSLTLDYTSSSSADEKVCFGQKESSNSLEELNMECVTEGSEIVSMKKQPENCSRFHGSESFIEERTGARGSQTKSRMKLKNPNKIYGSESFMEDKTVAESSQTKPAKIPKNQSQIHGSGSFIKEKSDAEEKKQTKEANVILSAVEKRRKSLAHEIEMDAMKEELYSSMLIGIEEVNKNLNPGWSYGEDITEELFDIRRSHWDSGSPSGKSQITRYLREIQEGEGMVEMIKEVKMKGKCKKECERKEKQEKNDVEDHSHQCFTDSNERNNFHSDPHLTKTPKTSRLLEPICPRTLIIDPLSFLRKCEEHKMNHKLQSTESGGAVPHTPQQEIKDLKKNNSKTVVINPLEYLKRCEKNPVGDKENNTFSTVFDKDFLSNSQTSKDVNESCQSKLSDVDNVLQNHNTNNVNSFIKAKCEPEVKMNIDSTQEVWLPSLVTQPLYYVDVPNLHHKAEKRKWQDMRTFYPQNPEITNFPQNVIYNAPSPSNPSSHNSFYEANAQHPSRSSTGRSFLLVPNHPASCRRVCPSESLQPVTLIPRYQTGHLSTVGPQTEISEATNFQFYISRDNELSSQSSGHQSGGSQPNSHDMILHMSPAQQLGQGIGCCILFN
ncbi:uncharacterized protein LOC143032989 [Oratosquilla oratoria]|uniref:uncharacterized protein LOC143032989 n=1 Tax=Oratosquilla oratoria TaxID=337810 RepID=UPI003F75FC97